MKVELIDVSETKKTLNVEVPLEVVDAEIGRITQRYARSARLPGFRPGKAPLTVVRQRFKEQILHDVAHDLIPRVVGDALKERGVEPVDTPQVRDMTLEEGQPLVFTAAVETAPPVDPGDLSTLQINGATTPVSDDEVDQALSRLRDRLATFEPVTDREAQHGDTVVMDLTRRRLTGAHGAAIEPEEPEAHTDVSAEIGAAGNPPGFDEGLVGLTPDATRTFDVVFPEEYDVEDLAGARMEYAVTAKAVRRRVLPPLDDELAKSLGEFETLDDLRARVRTDLEQDAANERRRRMRQQILEQLAARVSGEIPESMVSREIDRRVEEFVRRLMDQGVDPRHAAVDWEAFRTQQQGPADATVRSVLALDAIAVRDGVEVSTDELAADIQGYATRTGRPLPEVYTELARQGRLDQIRTGLLREKSLEHALTRATIEGV